MTVQKKTYTLLLTKPTLTLLTAILPPSRHPSRRCRNIDDKRAMPNQAVGFIKRLPPRRGNCSSHSSSQRFAPPPQSDVVATVPSPSSEQSSLATFRAKTRNIRRSLAPPFRKKSRLYFLFVCKRTHDENTALPTFCGSRLRRDCALACGSGSPYSLLTFYPPTL